MLRQSNVLRLEPSIHSQPDTQHQDHWAGGNYFSTSQPITAAAQQDVFQTPQQCGHLNQFQRTSNSPLRFRSAFAKQQIARSQSPLGRLAQRTFSQPSPAVWSPSEDENMSQNVCMSQSRSASLQPRQQAACPNPRQRSLMPTFAHTSQQHFAVQDSQPAMPLCSSSQEEQLILTTNVARPSSAMRGGVDTASVTAAKLLDQIGHMSSIEGQVKEVSEEIQALKKACDQIGGVVEGVQVNADKLDKMETAMSQIAGSAAEANTKTLAELDAVKQACGEILAAVKSVAVQLMAHVQSSQLSGMKQIDAGMLNSGNEQQAAAAKTDTHGGDNLMRNSSCAACLQPTEHGQTLSDVAGSKGTRKKTGQHQAGQNRPGMQRAGSRAVRIESRRDPGGPWRRKHRAPAPVQQQPPAAVMKEGGDSAPSQSRSQMPAEEDAGAQHVRFPVHGGRRPGSRSDRLQDRPLQLTLPRLNPDAPPPASPSLHYDHPLAPDTVDEAITEAAAAAKHTAYSRAPLAENANAAGQEGCAGGACKRQRRQSAEPLGGLSDPFAALFAKAAEGDQGCGAAAAEVADTAAIDDQEIQREVKRRMLMQRMKRMRP